VGESGAFSVASVNVGASGSIIVSADTGSAALPLGLALCQTNPATGECLGAPQPSITLPINALATTTFSVFLTANGVVADDPSANRIFVRFRQGALTRGSTGVAVCADAVALPTHATYAGALSAATTNCTSGDSDAFTLSGRLTVDRSGSTFSAAGDLSVTRFGVLFTAHASLQGSVSAVGQLGGTYTEHFSGTNGFTSNGSGTFTGTLTPTTLTFTISGTDTDSSGDTCHLSGTFQGTLTP
jgi:hypothetical protein